MRTGELVDRVAEHITGMASSDPLAADYEKRLNLLTRVVA